MPDIHEHFCPFCDRWLGEGSALCSVCRRPMCQNCLHASWKFPDQLRLEGRARLVYEGSYRDGHLKCRDCRRRRAEEDVRYYCELTDLPTDPILWVAHVTGQGFATELPEAPDHYDPIPSWLVAARDWDTPTITVRRALKDDTLHPRRVETTPVTGWHVPNGGVHYVPEFTDYGGSYGGDEWCDVVVLDDGTWFGLLPTSDDPSSWQTGHSSPGRGNVPVKIGREQNYSYRLNPRGFIVAARRSR